MNRGTNSNDQHRPRGVVLCVSAEEGNLQSARSAETSVDRHVNMTLWFLPVSPHLVYQHGQMNRAVFGFFSVCALRCVVGQVS